ncbi:cytochrome P450 [Microtetraspora fusca]|uniref:cytochrome P450 n=1 Tax=Microtetraspora fusca TaxID=1997 RepID=UPI000835B327|nr:cytochrome P450 [Microtetraspora fusca]
MAERSVFKRILDYSNRADPYPLYAELRETPVVRDDGRYVVSTYREIVELLHDPRISSIREEDVAGGGSAGEESLPGLPPAFIRRDPPDHDRIRRVAMRHFGPPRSPGRVEGLRGALSEIVVGLIDGFAGRTQVDVVDDFAYPLPVTAICRLLGVPTEDESRFRVWASALVEAIDPRAGAAAERRRVEAGLELRAYLNELAEARLRQPSGDLLSALVTDDGAEGAMSRDELLSTASLLLVAGHETTVNLITNGMLTLLRHPAELDRLRRDPGRVVPLVEELLRYEPPVQMLPQRIALDDIEIAGTTIPKGATITLVLAAADRDPGRFPEPDRFDPDRADKEHLGFGGGIHFCFGAPLARLETQLALSALASRLENPRLVADPPPYRENAALRGPRHLLIEFDGIVPSPGT